MKTKRSISDWLSRFEIVLSSASTSVFNNSRQQVEVIILARPNVGQELSQREFDSLRIVSQKVIGIYDPLPEDASAPWFYSEHHDERFDYFPALNLPPLPEPPPPPGMDEKDLIREDNPSYWLNDNEIRYKQRYIHSQAPAGSKVTLRVAITRDADDGGKGEDYYSDDIYDSSIDLYAHPAPNYVFPQDYHWAQTRNEGDTVGGSRFIHEHRLMPIEVPFSYAQCEPDNTNGMIRWQDHQPDQTFASHVGIAWPGNKTVLYDTSICLGPHFPARQVEEVNTDNTGAVIVLLQGDNQIPYYEIKDTKATKATKRDGPCRLSAYDRHGNRHRLSIAFDGTQSDPLGRRSKLTVVNTSTLDEQTSPLRVANIAFFQVKGLGLADNNVLCKLHNSARQPTFIDVVIRALDDKQQPVQLTPAELNKIELVRYDTGAALGSQYTTYISEAPRFPDDLFDVLGTQVSTLQKPLQSDQTVRFWIKTSGEFNLQVAARLVLDGVTYHTYQKDLSPGGNTVAGKSNSSATLAALKRNYDLPPSSFSYGRVDIYNNDGKDIDMHRLWISDRSYKLCYSSGNTTTLHYRNYKDNIQRIQQHYRLDYKRTVKVSPDHALTAEINGILGNAYASRLLTNDGNGYKYSDAGYLITYYDQNGYGWPLWVSNLTNSFGVKLKWIGANYVDLQKEPKPTAWLFKLTALKNYLRSVLLALGLVRKFAERRSSKAKTGK
ncbi:hypothetical protein [Pseudomonas sichuanensis]|uniref:hypothetical protein n=1 Tax=Pseudomonas TaxID=286 RepID=UPI0036E945DF